MTAEALFQGFKLAFENAKRLYYAAENLEKIEEYPIANSLLILSAEEAIKAYVLCNNAILPKNQIGDFEKYFSSHNHKIKSIDNIMMILIEKYQELYLMPIFENVRAPKNELIQVRKDSFNKYLHFLESITKNKNNSISKQSGWCKQAENNKKRGFYVNLKKGKWNIPVSITGKDYQKSKLYVGNFLNRVEFLYKQDIKELSLIIQSYKDYSNDLFEFNFDSSKKA